MSGERFLLVGTDDRGIRKIMDTPADYTTACQIARAYVEHSGWLFVEVQDAWGNTVYDTTGIDCEPHSQS